MSTLSLSFSLCMVVGWYAENLYFLLLFRLIFIILCCGVDGVSDLGGNQKLLYNFTCPPVGVFVWDCSHVSGCLNNCDLCVVLRSLFLYFYCVYVKGQTATTFCGCLNSGNGVVCDKYIILYLFDMV